ncbi:signal peptidase I [Halobacteriales archaeon Cl-PHB]
MRETATKIGHALGVGLVLGAVILAVLFVAPGLVGAESAHVVNSDSMSPAISAGDVVVVQDVETSALAAGDVITYRSDRPADSQFVTHRIVDLAQSDGQRQFRTKGDANEGPDPELVPASAVQGRVWVTIPLVGHLVAFAGSDLGLVAFVVVPAVVLVLTEAYSLYQDAVVEADPEGGGE